MENVSLVKSELMPGFSLRKTLGEPKEAAEKLLSTVIAPPDSGKCLKHMEIFFRIAARQCTYFFFFFFSSLVVF